MEADQIRHKFLKFFEGKGHQIVSSAPLVTDDPSVLLTTAGMQPFKKYFLSEKSPFGSRVTSCQKCFRTSDIDQVGDQSHLTFLEMLGNFSFGDYFKTEAAAWALEILTKEYQLPLERLRFTYFGGDKGLPADLEIKEIWQKLGISSDVILPYGREDNFWGPTGRSGPCGPTTEIHYDSTGQPCSRGDQCQPGCSCGRFVEIWNLVFNQYYQDESGVLSPLEQVGIDTGMGLERLTLAVQGVSSVFETDLFQPMLEHLNATPDDYHHQPKPYRILFDHLRGVIFLVSEGIEPSNVEQGYVLRRIIRRLIEAADDLQIKPDHLSAALKWLEDKYFKIYPEIQGAASQADLILEKERNRLSRAIQKGLSQLSAVGQQISGQEAFKLYSTYGLSPQELEKQGYQFDRQEVERAIEEHKKISRRGAEKKFGGHGLKEEGLSDQSQAITKLHTATHLLQAALREVLGSEVRQRGSDINPERLRFDFSFSRPLTEEELMEVSRRVNQYIQSGLAMTKESMKLSEAEAQGVLTVEGHQYPTEVDVYAIINRDGSIVSREVCAGPHVKNTQDLGRFRIVKEQSSSAGIRRIKAILEDD